MHQKTCGETREVQLATGKLTLSVDKGPLIDNLCDFAARANPKRGFLIVSRVLGRHLPARPSDMRQVMEQLADQLPDYDLGPVVFLGMAETATALGQGVFAAYQEKHSHPSVYLQTSRQRVEGARIVATFEEGHSHATTHLVQVANANVEHMLKKARALVIVDDESSTGNTFVGAAEGMRKIMPELEEITTVCITDWSDGTYLARMGKPASSVSVLSGQMRWEPGEIPAAATLAAGSNEAGTAPATGMRSRAGLVKPERALRPDIDVYPGERILVLGDGEHSYEALLIAEEVERRGGVAAVQCITRSPVLPGHAMQSISHYDDAYKSGAPCFLYNIDGHKPDRILIAAEIPCTQVERTKASLSELGVNAQVELVHCQYQGIV